MPHALSPRFGVDRIVQLDGLPRNLTSDEEFKISFALLNMEAMTPWISVATGTGKCLSQLELSLSEFGGNVRGMRWTGEYVDYDDASEMPSIELRLSWVHEQVISQALVRNVLGTAAWP